MFLKLWNYVFKIWFQFSDSVCKECVSISLLKKLKKKKKILQAKHKLEIEQKKKKEINIYFLYRLSQKKKQKKKSDWQKYIEGGKTQKDFMTK